MVGGVVVLLPGEAAGDYGEIETWTNTFDMFFLVFMGVSLLSLMIATQAVHPQLWGKGVFWGLLGAKFGLMMSVSVVGGWICRYFCDCDEQGYIMTTNSSWFKVNYTRKIQHFAAYMIPLVLKVPESCGAACTGVLADFWSEWATLLGFLVLIKPIRESTTVFMLQFNSLDRPEDRPYTLKWIVLGNILPGMCLIILFRSIYAATGHPVDLVFIFVYITGVGDGLAEPVGIWLGKHKYKTRSCFSPRRYTRSWEGSVCVFLSGLIFPLCQPSSFESRLGMWLCAVILAPCMAWAEAVSPHTMDTPCLMGAGGLLIFLVVHFVH